LIVTDDFHIVKSDGTTTIAGLHVVDTDPAASTETFTVSAATEAAGSSVTPATDSGLLADINTHFNSGITYNPGSLQPSADKVVVTVTDGFGASDTVNFVFNQGGSGPGITLTGTAGKDVIFATGNSDILTGGGGQDQFVFKPTSGEDAVQHTITDFVAGLDKIDLRLFHNITSLDGVSETQSGNDTLVTLDSHDSLLLKNVVAANLHANDFIISLHSA
jgi:Ca2+-binding RTX toxin-like protein